MARVFKARMILYAAYGHCIIREDGSYYEHPHWFELAKDRWAQVYKTAGTPCSCWMCRGLERVICEDSDYGGLSNVDTK